MLDADCDTLWSRKLLGLLKIMICYCGQARSDRYNFLVEICSLGWYLPTKIEIWSPGLVYVGCRLWDFVIKKVLGGGLLKIFICYCGQARPEWYHFLFQICSLGGIYLLGLKFGFKNGCYLDPECNTSFLRKLWGPLKIMICYYGNIRSDRYHLLFKYITLDCIYLQGMKFHHLD